MALLVPIAEVCLRAGLDPAEPSVAAAVTAAIEDATVDAEAYLKRRLTVVEYTEAGLRTDRWGEWPVRHDPLVALVTVTAELGSDGLPTGLYTIVYRAGLDGLSEELAPVRRWIRAAAAYAHPLVTKLSAASRVVKTVSADGQSVTYDNRPPAAGAPTEGVPPMSTMDRWRRRDLAVYTRPGWAPDPRF